MAAQQATLSERMEPLPSCSDIVRLEFDGRLLSLAGAARHTYAAASGKTHGDFSVARPKDMGLGPLPEGEYWIDPAQLWTAGPVRDFLATLPLTDQIYAGWGHHRITLHILPATQTFGRGGFFIHGGTHLGSAGCIHVQQDDMEAFVKDLQDEVKGLPSCSVHLTVRYPK